MILIIHRKDEGHSLNKMHIAEEVGSRTHCVLLKTFFKGIDHNGSFHILEDSARPSLLTTAFETVPLVCFYSMEFLLDLGSLKQIHV